jgi:hypothetical protein
MEIMFNRFKWEGNKIEIEWGFKDRIIIIIKGENNKIEIIIWEYIIIKGIEWEIKEIKYIDKRILWIDM